nr:YhgE/Pip family protein [Microterricola viridarii]
MSSLGEIIGMVFVPVGLWIGALAIFLLMRPVSAVALGSTASTGRIVSRGLLRGFAIAAAQVLVVVALLHTTLGVSWASLPATLGFSLLMAAAFVAVHHFLVTALGRSGVVVSLVLLALQLTSAGGLYPIEILAAPFQLVSPLLPLTWAVQGMQAIVAGVGGSAVGVPAAALAVFALLGALGSLAVVARRRGASSFAFALAQG